MFVLGDFTTADTLYLPFDTFDSNGASVTITGLAVTDIEIYKDGSITQRASDNGYALLDTDGIDFDGTVGLHGFSINLADNSDASFYAAGSTYWVNVNAITVDSQTVRFTYYFTIGRLLKPTTAGRTLDLLSTGEAAANATYWAGAQLPSQTTAGYPDVNMIHLGGVAQSMTDLKDFADAGYDPGTNKVQGVVLVDTTTTNTDMVGTDPAGVYGRIVHYVDANQSDDTGDGLSWDTADKTIGAAITAASAGDMIRIGPGTYSETVNASALDNLAIIGAGPSTILTAGNGNLLSVGNGTLVESLKLVNTGGTSSGLYCSAKSDVVLRHLVTDSEMDSIYAADSVRLRIEECNVKCAADCINVDDATDWLFVDTIIETDCTNSTSIAHRAVICEMTAGYSGTIRGGAIIAARNDTGAAHTIAFGLSNHEGGNVTLQGVTIIARQINGAGSGNVQAVSSVGAAGTIGNIHLQNCHIYTNTAGGGTARDLWQQTGTLSVDGATQYDTAKTSGTITRLAPNVSELEARTLVAASYSTQAKLLAYVQLLARRDESIETDNATELTEINADGGSGKRTRPGRAGRT